MADKTADAEGRGRVEANRVLSVAGTAGAWRRGSWVLVLAGWSLLALVMLGCGPGKPTEEPLPTACISNLHMLAIGLQMYGIDMGAFPPPYDPQTGQGGLSALVLFHLDRPEYLTCPDDPMTLAQYNAAHGTTWDQHQFVRCYSSYNQYYNSWGFDSAGKRIENEAEARRAYAGKADHLGRPLWDSGAGAGPSAAFPGLVNRNAPDNTIATRCPWHRTRLHPDSDSDLALRLDGSVQVLDLRSYDWVTQPLDQGDTRTAE